MANNLDKSNLRQAILDSPKQFKVGFDLAKDIKLDGKFTRATFHGEGGSAFPVSLVNILVNESAQLGRKVATPIFQNHTYSLTAEDFESSLNVFCSYSGNTEEAISGLNESIENNLPSIGVACGGQVEEICKAKNIPLVKLPLPYPEFQPRMGSGYFIGAILQLLVNHGLTADKSSEILESALKVKESLESLETIGKSIAQKVVGKTPVVWSSQKYRDLARVWTIKFNEHAKNPAFWNFFSELNHNSMVGFTNLGNKYFAIMLKDPDDEVENLKRYDVTMEILKGYDMGSEILALDGNSASEKMFKSLCVADFAGYYLALENKVDPTPVAMVEELKKRLKDAT